MSLFASTRIQGQRRITSCSSFEMWPVRFWQQIRTPRTQLLFWIWMPTEFRLLDSKICLFPCLQSLPAGRIKFKRSWRPWWAIKEPQCKPQTFGVPARAASRSRIRLTKVLSFAFNPQTIEKDVRKGQQEDWVFNLPVSQFAVDVSHFAEKIAKCMEERLFSQDWVSILFVVFANLSTRWFVCWLGRCPKQARWCLYNLLHEWLPDLSRGFNFARENMVTQPLSPIGFSCLAVYTWLIE